MNKKIYLLLLLVSFCVMQCSETNNKRKTQKKTEKRWSKKEKIGVGVGIGVVAVGVVWLLREYFSVTPEMLKKAIEDNNLKAVQKIVAKKKINLTHFIPLEASVRASVEERVDFLKYAIGCSGAQHKQDPCNTAPIVACIARSLQDDWKGNINKGKISYLQTAIEEAPTDVVRTLLQAKAFPNSICYDTENLLSSVTLTPLHVAARRYKRLGSDDGCVKALLEAKAIYQSDSVGRTPIDFVTGGSSDTAVHFAASALFNTR